jgi:hypothetical protein
MVGLLPRPRQVLPYAPARFRVRLLALPPDSLAWCLPTCVAQWLDAAPGALGEE